MTVMRDPNPSRPVTANEGATHHDVPTAARALWRQSQRALSSKAACPSPCISVCRMSPHTQLCEGCWRNLDELRVWGQATDAFKREVWQRIQQRLRRAFPQGLA
jgi:predicted Fe-S protein YdhL (DUF1289 family)